MSKTLEKISNHYQKAIAGDLEKIKVEEWDMDIYCKRTYPFKDEAKMIELQSQGKTVEALVESLIVKALDKDGKRLFQDGHKASLRREVNATTLQDIQLAMINSGSEYKLEEAKATLKS